MLLFLSMLAASPSGGNWKFVVSPTTTCTSSIVNFAPGSERFDAASALSLGGTARAVRSPRARAVRLLVVGYAQPHPGRANTLLAQRRVNGVMAFLISRGVAPGRIRTEIRRDRMVERGQEAGVVVDALTPLRDIGLPRGSGGAC